MEQQIFFDFGDFDPDSVDTTKTPANVEEYMRQVYVDRAKCSEVVYIRDIPTSTKATSSKAQPSLYLANIGNDGRKKCPFAPSFQWQTGFAERFKAHRAEVEANRLHFQRLSIPKLPAARDFQKWYTFCFEQRHPSVPVEPGHEEAFGHHKGTPPTTRLLMSLSSLHIDGLLIGLVRLFKTQGYSRALFEWLFSVMLFLHTPLQHDVCAVLRDFARLLYTTRAGLEDTQAAFAKELTIFIAIVSLVFAQGDLKDNFD